MKYVINHKDMGGHLDFELEVENPITEMAETLQKWRLEMEEAAIRDALIRRGWTPPKDDLPKN